MVRKEYSHVGSNSNKNFLCPSCLTQPKRPPETQNRKACNPAGLSRFFSISCCPSPPNASCVPSNRAYFLYFFQLMRNNLAVRPDADQIHFVHADEFALNDIFMLCRYLHAHAPRKFLPLECNFSIGNSSLHFS